MSLIKAFLICLLALFQMKINAQVFGTVLDKDSHLPLEGVVIQSLSDTTVSSGNGSFKIAAKQGSFLIIRHLAYKTDTFYVGSSHGNLQIELVPQQMFIELVTVHAPYFSMKLNDMPISVGVINRKSILLNSSLDFSGTLNLLPGIFMHSGSLTTSRILIRGAGSRSPYSTNRIKAYFNEIPLSQTDGTTVIEDIPPFSIQSISVIKGSKSAMYGSGLGGVLLLKGVQPVSKGFHGNIQTETGNFGTLVSNLAFSAKTNNTSAQLIYSNTRSDGYRENSSYNRHNFFILGTIEKAKSRTDVVISFTSLNAYIPSSIDSLTFLNHPEKAAPSWLAIKGFEEYTKLLAGVSNKQKLSETISNSIVATFSYTNSYESRPFNILDDKFYQFGIKSWFVYAHKGFHSDLGFEMQNEKYEASFFETNQGTKGPLINSYIERRNYINLFLELGYEFSKKLRFEAGLNLNVLKYTLADEQLDTSNMKYTYPLVLSPFAGINYAISDFIRFYTSFGHGFSHPSVEETLLPQGDFNPGLKPENGYNFDLGFRINSSKSNLFFDVAYYLLYIDDMLVTKRISEAEFYSENAGSSINQGVESSLNLRSGTPAARFKPEIFFTLSSSASLNRFHKFIDDGQDFSGYNLPGIPQYLLNGALNLNFMKGLYIDIHTQLVGRQYLNDANSSMYKSYALANFKGGYKFSLGQKVKTEIFIGIKNLGNEKYASMILVNAPSVAGNAPRYYYPGMPRYYFGGFDLKF